MSRGLGGHHVYPSVLNWVTQKGPRRDVAGRTRRRRAVNSLRLECSLCALLGHLLGGPDFLKADKAPSALANRAPVCANGAGPERPTEGLLRSCVGVPNGEREDHRPAHSVTQAVLWGGELRSARRRATTCNPYRKSAGGTRTGLHWCVGYPASANGRGACSRPLNSSAYHRSAPQSGPHR
jgi:hypothetical protein